MSDPSAERRSAPRELLIDDRHAGQRIDNFLSTALKGEPRDHIYRCLRRGEVRVNKGRIRQHYRLRTGDVVRIPPLRLVERPATQPPAAGLLARLEGRILFEDAGLLVVDKPAGMASHGGSGVSHGLIETLRAARPRAAFLELVHRLDRDTSGCLMVAKKRGVLTALHGALREGKVDKRYLLVVKGRWRRPRTVDGGLEKNVARGGERVVRHSTAGKPASTRFRPLATTARATLLEARPLTGRTHQIRVHAAAAGHPVAGDPKYGDREFNRELKAHGLTRLFLHASAVEFANPGRDGGRVRVQSPLPSELARVALALDLATGVGGPISKARDPGR